MHLETDNSASITWKHQVIFLALMMFLGEFLAGLFFLFTNYKEKTVVYRKKPNRFNHSYNTMKKFQGDKLCRCSLRTYSFIFLAGFLDFISVAGTLLISAFIGQASNTSFALKAFQIITTGLACYYFLKMPIYKHQYLACGIIIVGVLLKSISYLSNEIHAWYHIILLLLIFALTSLQETLLRWIMDERHISPLHLLCFEGVFGIMLCLTVFLLANFIECPTNSLCKIKGPLLDLPNLLADLFKHWPTILYVLGYVICSGGFNGFGRYVAYYLTPTHRLITDTFSSVFVWLLSFLIFNNRESGVQLYLNIVCYLLLALGCLIYHEVIILKFWGLSDFTKREITKRCIRSFSLEENELELLDSCSLLKESNEEIGLNSDKRK